MHRYAHPPFRSKLLKMKATGKGKHFTQTLYMHSADKCVVQMRCIASLLRFQKRRVDTVEKVSGIERKPLKHSLWERQWWNCICGSSSSLNNSRLPSTDGAYTLIGDFDFEIGLILSKAIDYDQGKMLRLEPPVMDKHIEELVSTKDKDFQFENPPDF